MKNTEDVGVVKYLDIHSVESAIEIYKNMKQVYLELRLSSKQNQIKNYVGKKNIMKKNMARALTYISKHFLYSVDIKGETHGR